MVIRLYSYPVDLVSRTLDFGYHGFWLSWVMIMAGDEIIQWTWLSGPWLYTPKFGQHYSKAFLGQLLIVLELWGLTPLHLLRITLLIAALGIAWSHPY